MDDMTKMLYERRDLWRIQPVLLAQANRALSERVEELEAALKGDHRTLAPGAVQAARMLERERIVAWLRGEAAGFRPEVFPEPNRTIARAAKRALETAATKLCAIERGEHEEDGNG